MSKFWNQMRADATRQRDREAELMKAAEPIKPEQCPYCQARADMIEATKAGWFCKCCARQFQVLPVR